MKRLNPNTGLPFKRGDLREDGYIFYQYSCTKIKKNGLFEEQWSSPKAFRDQVLCAKQNKVDQISTKAKHIKKIFDHRKSQSIKHDIPFDVSLEYLVSIAPETCPVFGIPLSWTKAGLGVSANSPSIDKIIPSAGYIVGNVQWLSLKANKMKQDASIKELKQFANWILTTDLCDK